MDFAPRGRKNLAPEYFTWHKPTHGLSYMPLGEDRCQNMSAMRLHECQKRIKGRTCSWAIFLWRFANIGIYIDINLGANKDNNENGNECDIGGIFVFHGRSEIYLGRVDALAWACAFLVFCEIIMGLCYGHVFFCSWV